MHHILVSVLISLFALTAHAEEAKRTAINLLMDKSGINRQVEQIPQQMMQGMQKQANSSGNGDKSIVFGTLSEAVKYAYKTDKMLKDISDAMYNDLADDEVIEVLGWYASEAGQRVTASEVATSTKYSTPAGVAEIEAFMNNLNTTPPSKERIALLQRLDNAIHATDFLVGTTLNTTVAFIKAMQKTLPESAQKNDGQNIEVELEKQSALMKPIMAGATIQSFLFSYKDVSDEDIMAYIAFCESPAGSKFYQSSLGALKDTLSKTNAVMSEHFAANIKMDSIVPQPPGYEVPGLQ